MKRLEEKLTLRGPDVTCLRHINPELEVLYVLQGTVTAERDGQRYTLTAGQALLIPPYHLHVFQPGPGTRARVYMMAESVYRDAMDRGGCPEGPAVTVPPAAGAYLEELEDGRSRWRPDTYAGTVLALFRNLFAETATRVFPADTEDWDRVLLDYLADHLAEGPTVAELAARVGRSPRQLGQAFRARYGIRLPELIRNMQVDRAVTMLETGTKTVTEIAAECGFSSLRSFNRVFYEAMGETPTQCRRRVRNEERK